MHSSPTTARGRTTRALLISAAREVFEADGFHDARISDIAERAGTSYGLFYTYFSSKEEILDEVLTEAMADFVPASLAAAGVSDPQERIAIGIRRYLDAARRHARLFGTLEELALRDPKFRELKFRIRAPYVQRIEDGTRRLQDRGLADQDLDARTVATMLTGMIEHFTLQWFVYGIEADEDLAVATLTRLWVQAIRLQPPSG